MTYDNTDDKWTTVNPKHNMMVWENLMLRSGIMFPPEKVFPVGLIYRYAQNKTFLMSDITPVDFSLNLYRTGGKSSSIFGPLLSHLLKDFFLLTRRIEEWT
jgi:hypothetical protein